VWVFVCPFSPGCHRHGCGRGGRGKEERRRRRKRRKKK
jgi:hypothetical protein